MKMIKPWIEAIRPKTLPVSIAGVFAASAYAIADGCFSWPQALLCLLFALLAQISSNFANEYYDFRAGLDRKGREGPRRGVTEGDITPRAMLVATYTTLALAAVVGLSLLYWGGWVLLPAGLLIVIGAIAYSAGPYPLSRHCLGEVAVVLFFGIVPVCLTYYLMALTIPLHVVYGSLAIGLAGANVLVVNNYRDIDDDRAVGKHTLAGALGRSRTSTLYLANWLFAAIFVVASGRQFFYIGLLLVVGGAALTRYLRSHTGRALNAALRSTAQLTLLVAILLLIRAIFA
jgi:1,4-dihydroxy-2-naphthoate octaprenyltransferase